MSNDPKSEPDVQASPSPTVDAANTNTEKVAEDVGGNKDGKDVKDDADKDKAKEGKDQEGDGNKKKRPAWLMPVMLVLVVILLIFGIPWGIRYWRYSHTHVSTDDAYITGNLTNVAPIISGTLQQLTVEEGSYVHRGQLLARLDPSGPQASLRQALATYHAALSQIPQAERNLAYQQQSTQAAILKAEASLNVQNSKTLGAARQVALTSGTTSNQIRQAQAATDQANAQREQNLALVQSAQATVDNDIQGVETTLASLKSYQQQIQTAQKALQAAQSRIDLAQADVDRDNKNEERYRVLYQQDAVSAQYYDQARAAARSSVATLQANQALAEEAQSQIVQARANALQAESQVEQSRKTVTQAQALVRAAERAADAAGKQVHVEEAAVEVAKANGLQVGVQQSNLTSTSQQSGESEADLATAQAGEEQVAVRRKQIVTYRAQAAEALAALTNAQITLNDTNIYAPTDGIVVRKSVNIGAALSAGQTIVTITQGGYTWVEANYKETQLNDIAPGEPVELEVDAIPGKTFKGHVLSINEASGTATSLLPADNATGNFTKVVQRIPVRIEFDAANDADDAKYARQQDIQRLRQGMSVVVAVDETGVDRYRKRQYEQANRHSNRVDGVQSGAAGPSSTSTGSAMGAITTSSPGNSGQAGVAADNGRGSSVAGGANNAGSATGNTASGMMNGQNAQQSGSTSAPTSTPNPGAGGINANGQNGGQNTGQNSGVTGTGTGNGTGTGAGGAGSGAGAGGGGAGSGSGGAGR